MADQNPQHGRRQHFHRGRRGQDRRGNDRRGPGPSQPSEQGARDHREHVDVEQIMREIRSRISQRHGIELSTQQIQELAARRLEAILDPRTVKPSLLEQIRRSTTTPLDAPPPTELAYSFEDTTLYESHRGFLRFMRRLLHPLLKLFFNPNPLISALNTQAKINQAAVQREAELHRRQTEWNALHYEVLQRLVLEIARTSLEAQQLSLRVEALSAKVEFAERRARSIEGTLHQARPAPRHGEGAPPPLPVAQQPRDTGPGSTEAVGAPVAQEGAAPTPPGEGGRRRRRRRRGRRPQGFTPEGAVIGAVAGAALPEPARAAESVDVIDAGDADDVDEDDGAPEAADETDNGVAEPSRAIDEAAIFEVESSPGPVEPPAAPPEEGVSYASDPQPSYTSGPESATPDPQPTESVVPAIPDRQEPPDAVGD
jgi:hypothetical protein